ncbi:putative nuclease HARBI1 [Bemisia tabaci]|uniref:putative nuclease HARBI1 n=1 Tax=Bemisia tabaci TaxID=7038 RepID=UPI003B28C581
MIDEEEDNMLMEAALQILEQHLNAPMIEPLDFSDSEDDTDNSSGEEINSDEEEDLPAIFADQEEHVRNENYVIDVVYYLSDRDFRSHFRLSRTAVEELYLELNNPVEQTVGRPRIPMAHVLLLSLWILATKESFRSVADRFGLDRGHAHVLCMQIYQKMYESRNTWIRWPTGAAAVRCIDDFADLGIPGVIGVVDGSYIEIPGPVHDDSYYNRKGFHSATLQGICDSHMRFIDVFTGFPSSVNDARVWAHSPIGRALAQNHEAHLPPGSFILGDKAYPCRVYLISLFKDDGHMTAQKVQFNTRLSKVRVVIENAFGRLKGIFRRMKNLEITNLNYFKYYTMAACILHNIVLEERFNLGDLDFEPDIDENDDDDDDDDDEDDDDDDDDNVEVGNAAPVAGNVANETGPERRIRLMNVVVPPL